MDLLQSKESIEALLQKYQETPILWNSKHALYCNKEVRAAALEELANYMQTWVPGCTANMVKDKLANLRSTYRRAYKANKSKKSGAAATQAKEPKLWYYKQMAFLRDEMEGRKTMSSLSSNLSSMLPSSGHSPDDHSPAESEEEGLADRDADLPPFDEEEEEISQEVADPQVSVSQEEAGVSGSQEEAGVSGSQEEAGVSGSQEEAGPSGLQQVPPARRTTTSQSSPPQVRPSGRRRQLRPVEEASLRMIQEASAIMRAPLNPTEAFSASLAHDLNEGEEDQRRLAKALMNQVLWWMQKGLLTPDTGLCDPARLAEHHPPAATSTPPARPRVRSAGRLPGGKAGKRRKR